MLRQLSSNPLWIRVFPVNLIDGNDEWNTCRFRVLNGLNCLRHDAVIRGNNQHDYIGGVSAACAHCCKCSVARCIEKRDLAFIRVH